MSPGWNRTGASPACARYARGSPLQRQRRPDGTGRGLRFYGKRPILRWGRATRRPGRWSVARTRTVEPELGLAVVWTADRAARDRVLDHACTLSGVRGVHAVRWTPALVTSNCERFHRPALRPPAEGGDPGPLLVFTLDGVRSDVVTELRGRA